MKEALDHYVKLIVGLTIYCALFTATIGAWVQHVITCIREEQWILLVFGVIVPPVGWIHGWGVWLGLF